MPAKQAVDVPVVSSDFLETSLKRKHVTHILQKLNLRDRVQAVVLAYQTGAFEADTRRPSSRDESPTR